MFLGVAKITALLFLPVAHRSRNTWNGEGGGGGGGAIFFNKTQKFIITCGYCMETKKW